MLFDSNWWKSFLVARLKTPVGEKSALTLFGSDSHEHLMFAEHLLAEVKVLTMGRGREVEEWQLRPHRPDNHFLDCLVGCSVGASMQGATMPVHETASKPGATAKKMREAFQRMGAK